MLIIIIIIIIIIKNIFHLVKKLVGWVKFNETPSPKMMMANIPSYTNGPVRVSTATCWLWCKHFFRTANSVLELAIQNYP